MLLLQLFPWTVISVRSFVVLLLLLVTDICTKMQCQQIMQQTSMQLQRPLVHIPVQSRRCLRVRASVAGE